MSISKRGKWVGMAAVTVLVAAGVAWRMAHRGGPDNLKPEVPNFSLLDQNGRRHTLHDYTEAKIVVLMAYGNSCPIVQNYTERIKELQAEYSKRGATFLLLDAHTQDDRESIAAELKDYGIELPVLIDKNQVVARLLGLKRTTETLIISPDGWRILYRGPIDDQMDYGVNKGVAQNHYLADALEAAVRGGRVPANDGQVKGCAFSFWKSNHLEYGRHIAPTVQAKCAGCHSPSKSLPLLTSEADVRGAADKIRTLFLMDRMPHAGGAELDSEASYHLFTWLEPVEPAAPHATAGGD